MATDGEKAGSNCYKTVLEKKPCVKEARTQKAELATALHGKPVTT